MYIGCKCSGSVVDAGLQHIYIIMVCILYAASLHCVLQSTGAASYSKFVSREMGKAEALLKVNWGEHYNDCWKGTLLNDYHQVVSSWWHNSMQVILSPVDSVANTYRALLPEGTPLEFQRILDLKVFTLKSGPFCMPTSTSQANLTPNCLLLLLLTITGLEESRSTSYPGGLQQTRPCTSPRHQTPCRCSDGGDTSCHSICPDCALGGNSSCFDYTKHGLLEGSTGEPRGRPRPSCRPWARSSHHGLQEVPCIDRGRQRSQGWAVPQALQRLKCRSPLCS